MSFESSRDRSPIVGTTVGATFRVIARLDVKAPNLVKGVRLEGLRVVGVPSERAHKYYAEGVDEIMYQDIVASLYGRASITNLVEQTARSIFIPLTVGGGVRSVDDVQGLLRAGADRVAANTALVERPNLIHEIATRYGSQCMTVSVEALKVGPSSWEVLTNCGRERTGLDVIEWVRRCVDSGAGEVLLTSVDREGTRTGFDLGLLSAVLAEVDVPVIAHGGAGSVEDVVEVARQGASGAAIASLFHYGLATVFEVKSALRDAGIRVRVDG